MIKKLASTIVAFFLITFAWGQEINVMTYNIRFNNPHDGENAWQLRKDGLSDQIKFYEPDILGIQEGLYHQVLYLDSNLTDWSWVGVGREDGKTKGEFSAIFYKKDRFDYLSGTTIWLSESPGKISVGWDAALERICTYALFRDKITDKQIFVFNTHFDHIGEIARKKSALLILSKIEEINPNNLPVILMGDLNTEPHEPPIQVLVSKMRDTRNIATQVSFGPDATFNGFDFQAIPQKRIDYIFTSKEIEVKKYAVLTDSKSGRYYSDHFAVFAVINSSFGFRSYLIHRQ